MIYRISLAKASLWPPGVLSCLLNGIGASCAALIFMAGYLGHSVLHAEYQSTGQEHLHAVTLMRYAPVIDSRHSDRTRRLQAARAQQQAIWDRFPTHPDSLGLLQTLTSLAQQTSLQLRGFRPEETTTLATHQEKNFAIQFDGSLKAFEDFLTKLRTSGLDCRVTSFDCTQPTLPSPANTSPTIPSSPDVFSIEVHLAVPYRRKTEDLDKT